MLSEMPCKREEYRAQLQNTPCLNSSGRMDSVRKLLKKSKSTRRRSPPSSPSSSCPPRNKRLLKSRSNKQLIRVDLASDDVGQVSRAISTLANEMCLGNQVHANRFSIFQMGGHVAILEAMDEFLECATVQAEGCRALRELTFAKGAAPFIQGIVNAGSIETIVGAMTEHPEDAKVQRNAISVLQKLANSGEEIKRRIARSGAIQVLLDTLESHCQDIEMQILAMDTISNLSRADDQRIREAIILCGGFTAIDEASNEHPNDPRVGAAARQATKQLLQ